MVSAVILAAVAGAGVFYIASASGRARTKSCPLNALRLSLQMQGTATQSVTFLMLENPEHLRCSFSARVLFEVEQHGHRAPIEGNPLRARLHATLRGAKRSPAEPDVWWANWCRSRRGLLMTARVGRRSITSPFNYLPYCFVPRRQSTLRLG